MDAVVCNHVQLPVVDRVLLLVVDQLDPVYI